MENIVTTFVHYRDSPAGKWLNKAKTFGSATRLDDIVQWILQWWSGDPHINLEIKDEDGGFIVLDDDYIEQFCPFTIREQTQSDDSQSIVLKTDRIIYLRITSMSDDPERLLMNDPQETLESAPSTILHQPQKKLQVALKMLEFVFFCTITTPKSILGHIQSNSIPPFCLNEKVTIVQGPKTIDEWTYPCLLVLQAAHQSRLHSILCDLTADHLMPPCLPHEWLTNIIANEQVKSIVFEISTNSVDERDRLLKDFSSINQVESIYVLGKQPETREERDKFLSSFCKVAIFCQDEEELAVRWALDTANQFRRLGGQCADAGNTDLARQYFQRGKDLYKGLAKIIDETK
ncbi:unnamed protein product [Adineta steineri]|uniref:Uncharacterized protein n=1 Tax=Adineta steineri TaxID=433720 RepID=A0A819CIB5_9BILA|nr:unnamed protein product [Adineta steineri]CAF3808584.1 unnamed protein product [Adineta steineri]